MNPAGVYISDLGRTVTVEASGDFIYTPPVDYAGLDRFTYIIDDGYGATSSGTVTIDILPVNDTPVIFTPPNITVAENFELAATIAASDVDDTKLTYQIVGGTDADLFFIGKGNMLFFADLPDFENPGDGNADNVYEVAVRVTDPDGLNDDRALSITVEDRDEIVGTDGDDDIIGDEGENDIDGGEGDDSLRGGAGNDHLRGGEGDDDVRGGEGDDRADGGEGNDKVKGGDGDDEVVGGDGDDDLRGGEGDDEIKGGRNDDALKGGNGDDDLKRGDGDDTLDGGSGNDTLTGGKGRDTLIGGDGKDIFIFKDPLDKRPDLIADFESAKDRISLDSDVYKALIGRDPGDVFRLGDRAVTEDDHLLYDQTTGILRYDEDGQGGGSAVEMAFLKNKATLTEDDFLIV